MILARLAHRSELYTETPESYATVNNYDNTYVSASPTSSQPGGSG